MEWDTFHSINIFLIYQNAGDISESSMGDTAGIGQMLWSCCDDLETSFLKSDEPVEFADSVSLSIPNLFNWIILNSVSIHNLLSIHILKKDRVSKLNQNCPHWIYTMTSISTFMTTVILWPLVQFSCSF